MIATPDNQPVRLTLAAGPDRTEIFIGRGLLAQTTQLFTRYRSARLLLVSDTRVAPIYAAPLCDALVQAGYTANILIIPAAEDAKTLDTLTELYCLCHTLQVERDDVVVAVGGGMVGDIAGMLAGTYLRGLEFVQVPTSLVAQVTASVGGKVGVNFGSYKNIIGLFKQPALVLVDLDTLKTLPADEFRSGLGELITVGVLGAPQIFETLEARGTADLTSLIADAIRCKGAIVEADPYDRLGIRATLNLGHTFGHALEKLSDFTLAHGLAVAVGLRIASQLAAELRLCSEELAERVRRTLVALDLPTTLTGYDPEQVVAAMHGDKKRSGGRMQFVLPVELGSVTLVSEETVPSALLSSVLRTIVAGAE